MLSRELRKELEDLPTILSIKEVAGFLSISHMTVYRMIYQGQLPAYKASGGEWNVNRSDLIRTCSMASNL